MSLYDQFFSDINKDFMFTMANNVLKKDHNIIIEGNENIKNIYLQDMKDIFENNKQISTSKLLTILEATSFDSLVFSKEIVSMITLYLPIFEDLVE